MSLLDGLRHRLDVLRRGESYARDIERELRFHAELETLGDEMTKGLQPRTRLGNITHIREEVRAVTPLHWFDRLRQDASYAWRGLVHSPAFTVTVVVTLGLGIGVNAAMYAFLDRLFLRAPDG